MYFGNSVTAKISIVRQNELKLFWSLTICLPQPNLVEHPWISQDNGLILQEVRTFEKVLRWLITVFCFLGTCRTRYNFLGLKLYGCAIFWGHSPLYLSLCLVINGDCIFCCIATNLTHFFHQLHLPVSQKSVTPFFFRKICAVEFAWIKKWKCWSLKNSTPQILFTILL